MIRPTDISIVVQGAVSPDTIRVVQQLQRNFCGAEIIIETTYAGLSEKVQ